MQMTVTDELVKIMCNVFLSIKVAWEYILEMK